MSGKSQSISLALVLILATILGGCDAFVSVPDGRIRIKNDFSGSEYSTFRVSGGGASYTLRAGEAKLLPKGTRSISFSYAGRDGQRNYRVQCPGDRRSGFTIKVLDVHSNRLPGGCETVWANR